MIPRTVGGLAYFFVVRPNASLEYSLVMAGKWLKLAQKMAQAARAGVAVEKKRLSDLLAEKKRTQVPQTTQSSR
ncbi:MAG: hypothetical protein LAO24_21590 [Acidobacteriia bacterium]|nr:hypothetical protein [Terriglobia bacterium]